MGQKVYAKSGRAGDGRAQVPFRYRKPQSQPVTPGQTPKKAPDTARQAVPDSIRHPQKERTLCTVSYPYEP